MQIDVPLSELLVWQGRNPRPQDHDAYWERALAEVQALDPEPEFRPAPFTVPFAECFDLYFSGVRGARIYAKFVRPKGIREKIPAVFLFHGYGANSGEWSRLLPYAASGMAAAFMECRGQGGRSEDPGGIRGNTLQGHIIRGLDGGTEDLLFRQIFLDTVQLVRLVSALPEVDGERLGVLGGSQGGGLALACAALSPKIKRAAPCFPFLCDYRRVWEMDLAKDAYQEIGAYFRRFDPRHEREEEVFTRLGYIDVQFLAPRIRGETLMFTGLMDTVCPPSSQFAAYNKITAKKSFHLYPDFGHEDLPGHSDLSFQFMLGL
jgi:cephalosporin-C deacetylase